MRFIGKSKIGKLSARKDKVYAQIRLPSQLADMIGERADIFETEHNGKRAFLLVTDQGVLENNTVLQPGTKVVKHGDENTYFQRLQALELEISELKSVLILNEVSSIHSIKKQKAEGEIRTRVVASTGP